MFSEIIYNAIKKTTLLHEGQTRKDLEKTPYISHLVGVALILSQYTSDEDIIIAGLLHDTIEDTSYTPEDLERDFGKKIKDIVMGVTEDKNIKNWKERKQNYLDNLKTAPEESLLVATADKIHNMTSLSIDFRGLDEGVLKKFSSNVQERIWFHEEVLKILENSTQNKIIEEYKKVFNKSKEKFITSS
ncbi:MAG: HD domain-containing protein [Candidatus Magasanikbacteria bacterium]|nr:HD domain-containing protein [Candidatus Magasanikbacteria bacterium]